MKLTAESTVFNDEKVQSKFSELIVDADGIRTEVGKKVGNDEVISRINQSAESVKIQAGKVDIEGATIFSSGRLSESNLDNAYDAKGDATSAVNGLKTDLASSSGTTVINGGHIETGTLDASAVNASSGTFDTANIPDLNASKITAGKIQSANRLIYFDLDANELVCSKITSPSFTTTNNRAVIEVPTKYSSISGSYFTYIRMYDSAQPTHGVEIRPSGWYSGGGYQYNYINSLKPIFISTSNEGVERGGAKLELGSITSDEAYIGADLYIGGSLNGCGLFLSKRLDSNSHFAVLQAGDVYLRGNTTAQGDLTVSGTKSRQASTENYSDRLLYCYETPTPLFGDIGEAVLDEDGYCYVDIDDIFSETIANQVEYQVFLQKEGQGDCWIADKQQRYFVIQGTPSLKVAWELKAKQMDYENIRLEQSDYGIEEYDYSENLNISLDDYITEQEDLLYGNY